LQKDLTEATEATEVSAVTVVETLWAPMRALLCVSMEAD
jgi:hypothetical protein